MGTFGGALEARHIDASNGKLTADVTGEVEVEEGVLQPSELDIWGLGKLYSFPS